MKKLLCVSVVLLSAAVSGCVSTGKGPAWQCSAQGMVDGSYGGGETAYIHLQGYSTGGDYRVKLNDQGNEASGTTANGTPFTCRKTK